MKYGAFMNLACFGFNALVVMHNLSTNGEPILLVLNTFVGTVNLAIATVCAYREWAI